MEKIEKYLKIGKKITLDDFSMISLIGRGTYAKVILVKKNDTDELFALKVMKKKKIRRKK